MISRLTLLLCVLLFLASCASTSSIEDDISLSNDGSATATPRTALSVVPSESVGGTVTITYGDFERRRGTFEVLMDTFMAANPNVHVKFVALDTLNAQFSRQDYTDTQYRRDVAHAADTFEESGSAATDFTMNLAPLMQSDPALGKDDFYDGVLQSREPDGAVQVLPHTVYCNTLAYNVALWEAAQLSPPPPAWDWDTLLKTATQLVKKRGTTVETYGVLIDYTTAVDLLLYELSKTGVDVTTTTATTLPLDAPEMVTALQQINSLIADGTLAPIPFSYDSDKYLPLVNKGRVAMWMAGMERLNSIDPLDVTMRAAPLPSRTGAPSCGQSGYAISAGTQHVQAAWRWITFLSRQNITQDYSGYRAIPARRSLAEQYWKDLDPNSADIINGILAGYARLQVTPVAESDLVQRLYKASFDIFAELHKPGQQPAQILQAAQKNIEDLAQAQPTPTIANEPFEVNTPIPLPAPAATSVRFAPVGLNRAALPLLVAQFQQQHPELAVQLVDARASGLQFAQVAQQSDCFASFQPPPPGAAGAVADLQPRLDADASFPRADYPPGVLAPLQRDGRLLGLPLRIGLPSLHANPAVFAAAGLPLPTASSSWSDLAATAQQLTSGRGAQKTLGFGSVGDLGAGARALLRVQGVPLMQGDPPQPAFTSPSVQTALPPLLDLLRPSMPVSATLDALVAQGQLALWLDTRPATPLTTSTDVDQLVPLPQSPGAAVPVDVTSALFLSAQSQQPDACWTWLRWLADQPLPPAGDYPARVSQAQSDSFAQQAPAGVADVYAAMLPALQQASSAAVAPDPLTDDPLAARWFDRAVLEALAGADLPRALDAAQATTAAYLACVQGGTDGSACARQVDPTFQEPGAGP